MFIYNGSSPENELNLMRQDSFSDAGFEKYRKKTRKEQFLEEMETIIPWKELTAAIEPFYPKPEGADRRPIGIERMLRSTSSSTGWRPWRGPGMKGQGCLFTGPGCPQCAAL